MPWCGETLDLGRTHALCVARYLGDVVADRMFPTGFLRFATEAHRLNGLFLEGKLKELPPAKVKTREDEVRHPLGLASQAGVECISTRWRVVYRAVRAWGRRAGLGEGGDAARLIFCGFC